MALDTMIFDNYYKELDKGSYLYINSQQILSMYALLTYSAV